MSRGYIYVLSTDERPQIVKIGKTTQWPDKRLEEINSDWYLSINTWKLAHWRFVENCDKAERLIHKQISAHRLPAKNHREVFRISVQFGREIVDRICERYPASSDELPVKKPRNWKTLDSLAYEHIKQHGAFAQQIQDYKVKLSDGDFYRWLKEVQRYL